MASFKLIHQLKIIGFEEFSLGELAPPDESHLFACSCRVFHIFSVPDSFHGQAFFSDSKTITFF